MENYLKTLRFLLVLSNLIGACLFPQRSYGWGNLGHYNITAAAIQELPISMLTVFQSSSTWLQNNSLDSAVRSGWDPYESYFHGIHLGGTNTGTCQWPFDCMPQTIPEFLAQYGYTSIRFNGYIEDTILTYCLSTALVNWKTSPTLSNYTTVMTWMCRIAHYMEDLSQPLHTIYGYNPEIHSRYETNMLDRFTPPIAVTLNAYSYQTNIIKYAFSMISTSYPYWTVITSADFYAQNSAQSTSSDLYYTLLWSSTQSFTTTLLNLDAIYVASLWYTAWVNAGLDNVSVDDWKSYASDKPVNKP